MMAEAARDRQSHVTILVITLRRSAPRLRPSRSIRVVVIRDAAQHAGRDDERRQHGDGELMEHVDPD